jgi:hypothetical protein
MSVFAFLFFVICSGQSFFLADQAYGICTGCCVCLYGGGYKNCPGCTPPGHQYGGITCPVCAVDPEAGQEIAFRNSGPSGMKIDLSVSMKQLETDELMRGGQCMRRSTELRFLGNSGEAFSLNTLNWHDQPTQFQVATQ